MTKWEYLYAVAFVDEIQEINGQPIGEHSGFFQRAKGRPSVADFLEKSGQDGWEAIGISPASENAVAWRILLKRPIS